MKTEADFKLLFKKSVRHYKGASISLAAPLMPGIPDLYVIIPGYMPVLLEAKWLGSVGERFHRKMNYTAQQIEYIRACCEVHPYAAFGLAGMHRGNGRSISAVLLKYGTPLFYRVDSSCFYECGTDHIEKASLYFNVPAMFEKAQIPKLSINKVGTELIKYSLTAERPSDKVIGGIGENKTTILG